MALDEMILAKNSRYSLNSYDTKLNNNVLVVGASGAGKTRGVVIPNIMQKTGSYIISDPKGSLYNKYKAELEEAGYEVKKLDFVNPEDSDHYNFFNYIHSTQDIVKIAHMLIYQEESSARHMDPFWDQAAQLLVQSIIAYLVEHKYAKCTLRELCNLITLCSMDEAAMDDRMNSLKRRNKESYAFDTYCKFKAAADKTKASILITVNAKIGLYDIPELNSLTSTDDIDIPSIGQKKTAVFVVISDTDRSLDPLANLFFTQAMNELVTYADRHCEDNRLPVPVRFILDDFATNCKIDEFPRMIASIRSRGISTMLLIQAESQLKESYQDDSLTIIANCDTYMYMGSNDIDTAESIAKRLDIPMKKVLSMPVGTCHIFRRGEAPYTDEIIDLEAFEKEQKRRNMAVEQIAV